MPTTGRARPPYLTEGTQLVTVRTLWPGGI